MPEMAFVYPIQEVTGAPDEFVKAGGDYLLSLPRMGSEAPAFAKRHPYSGADPDRPSAGAWRLRRRSAPERA